MTASFLALLSSVFQIISHFHYFVPVLEYNDSSFQQRPYCVPPPLQPFLHCSQHRPRQKFPVGLCYQIHQRQESPFAYFKTRCRRSYLVSRPLANGNNDRIRLIELVTPRHFFKTTIVIFFNLSENNPSSRISTGFRLSAN